jgi:putative Holliday junction resolvase
MGRILALDVGEKTIGVAISDETGTYAFPGDTIRRQPEGHRKDMAAIRRLIEANAVREIVVGLPLRLDGSRSAQTERVEAFIEILRRFVSLPVIVQDERLSTAEAERVLIAAGRRRDQRKQTVDSMAASLILQSYLDTKPQGVCGQDEQDLQDG